MIIAPILINASKCSGICVVQFIINICKSGNLASGKFAMELYLRTEPS
jgi:hypothetical protein